jgi:outer membrane lipoprotein SlyB
VHKDDGQRVTIAQVDDGDVQMGDRVVIVYDRNGVAKAVRDSGYRHD